MMRNPSIPAAWVESLWIRSAPAWPWGGCLPQRSEEHTSELQSRVDLVCRLLLEKKKQTMNVHREVEPLNLQLNQHFMGSLASFDLTAALAPGNQPLSGL